MELDAIDGDTIPASRKSMDRTPPQQPKPRRPRSHRSARLPDDCLKRLFEFAPLSSLLHTLLVSTPWRENALDDPRWDPILPPPALRAPSQWLRPSTRSERSVYARYYARYVLVLDNWRRAVLDDEGAVTTARGRTTALDGWFALAPWAKTGMRGGRPLAWLRHAVWLPEAARATDRLRRSARLPPRSRDQERCAFFNENHEDEQQEEGPLPLPVLPATALRRLETEGLTSVFSAGAAALADRLEWERQPPLSRTGVTVAYAHGNASEDPQLWGNVDQILWGCATIGAQFLSAYFGPGSSITLARRHIPGLAVGEEQNVASFRVEEPPGDSVRVVVTGTRIVDDGNRGRIVTSLTPRTRVLSFLDLGPGFELAARGACAIILHAALRAVGLPLCAHTRCALNPIETAGDLASASLLCCPVCYRRLELRGVPVHNTIQAVARVSKRWRDSSAWDLGVLARWGYVDMNEAAVDLTNA